MGAIAEFHDPEGQVTIGAAGTVVAVSTRGACRVQLGADSQAFAYEALSAQADAWLYGIAFTAGGRAGRGPARAVLTELGTDDEAIRADERTHLLFDLGVGMPNVDYCVRTGDRALLAQLRHYCGQPVTTAGHPLLEILITASPARVARSPLARVEVYQAIDRHRTPSGPHTHLLPDLLAHRRTHAANLPLPAQTLPLLTLHPSNPLFDSAGQRRAFAPDAYQHFETVLARHGVPAYVAEKARLQAALHAGMAPADYPPPRTRAGRLALRIGLRQLAHTAPATSATMAWLAHFRH